MSYEKKKQTAGQVDHKVIDPVLLGQQTLPWRHLTIHMMGYKRASDWTGGQTTFDTLSATLI